MIVGKLYRVVFPGGVCWYSKPCPLDRYSSVNSSSGIININEIVIFLDKKEIPLRNLIDYTIIFKGKIVWVSVDSDYEFNTKFKQC